MDRRTKWGNPFRDPSPEGPGVLRTITGDAAWQFRDFLDRRRRGDLEWHHSRVYYPSDKEIRAELAGRDLACWCKPADPCHADSLLEIANA